MKGRVEMKRRNCISLVLAFVLIFSLVPHYDLKAAEVHYIAIASDRHSNSEAIGNAMSGMTKKVEYVSIIGDFVGDSKEKAPEGSSSDIYNEIIGAGFDGVDSKDDMSLIWADHDKNVEDDADIIYGDDGSGSGLIYTGINSDGTVAYYIYSIAFNDMKKESNAKAASKKFMKWIDTIGDNTIPVFVFCHMPIHYARKDNKGGAIWSQALNYAATGAKTTEGGKTVIRNVIYAYGHNHTTESKSGKNSGEFYVPCGTQMEIGADEGVWSYVYYTYVTAGYLNQNGTASLLAVTPTKIKITKYDDGEVSDKLYDSESKKSGAFAKKFSTKGTNTIKRVAASSGNKKVMAPLGNEWSYDSDAAKSLRRYVMRVTNPADKADFIPKKDRIAVFDMDGTLTCETYYTYYDTMMFIEYCLKDHPEKVSAELKKEAESIKPGYTAGEALARNFAKAYAGMTVQELFDYAVSFGQKYTASFNNMRYIDGFYLPMVELVKYLYDNGFTIYVVSGTERTTTRAIVANSPISEYVTPEHVIGTEFEVKVKGNENTASNMDFKYADGDELVFTGGFIQKNLNANKSIYIEREIGMRPVLAFGNSGSDTSMMNYTIDKRNAYHTGAYMIVADDDVREWGTADFASKSEGYRSAGYVPVSMKNEFKNIYAGTITKAEVQYAK